MNSDLINNLKNKISFNGYSYPAYLAATGEENRVSQWIERVPEALYEAVYGYATVKNLEPMWQLINTSSDQIKSIKMAVRGLVRGNHLDELYKIKHYKEYSSDIVLGYAQAGNQDQVASMVQRDSSLFEPALHGYASAGRAELLDLVKGTRFYGEALYLAAKEGHALLVNQLLAECGFSENTVITNLENTEEIRLFGLLNKALSGYCHGYHLEDAGTLLAMGADIQTALDELKVGETPCIDAYSTLFIATPGVQSQALLEQIQRELTVLKSSLSASHINSMSQLQSEYMSKPGLTLIEFLTERSSASELNVLQQLDNHCNALPD